MATQIEPDLNLDLREQIARIDKMNSETRKLIMETKTVPVMLLAQIFIGMGALLGAGAAVAKVFF